MRLDELEFSASDEWEKASRDDPWHSFIPEMAKDSAGQEYLRGRGRTSIYKLVKEDDEGHQKYVCAECDSDIMAAKVAHPIWDGPFPMSGSGRCHNESVPYCPKCEEEYT